MAGILIFGELSDDGLQSITGELIAAGRGLSETLGDEVGVALFGDGVEGSANDAIALGADKVYQVSDPLLAEPHIDVLLAAFEKVCRETEPSVVLVGRTPMGRDVAPRLAFRLGVGMAQDSIEVNVDPNTKRVVATRPVYGGSAIAKVTFPESISIQIVVLRGKAYDPLAPDASRSGEVISIEANLDPSVIKARLVETVKQETEGIRLEDAPIVVAGGRGLGGHEPFEMLEELAKILGGAVGASRAVCDAGWMDHAHQVGLTGKTISPNLYITVGISGASQHMAGCSASKFIVAINRDPDANIFKAASFGVVGEWQNVLPSFIETIRELVES